MYLKLLVEWSVPYREGVRTRGKTDIQTQMISWSMDDVTKKTLAYVVLVLFIMVMLIPAIPANFEFGTWLVTLIIAAVIVPLVLFLSLRYAQKKTEEGDHELLTWRGRTTEEWIDEEDPDDFEGEID
jgi:hypothetical protein